VAHENLKKRNLQYTWGCRVKCFRTRMMFKTDTDLFSSSNE
jgi:hypothetical protein